MKKYEIRIEEGTVIAYHNEDENYGSIEIFEDDKKVGRFQITGTDMSEQEFIEKLENLNAEELMKRPYLYNMPKLIQDLHNTAMKSQNLCLYGEDMESWWTDDLEINWEEWKVWLEKFVNDNDYLDNIIEFGEEQYIVFGDFVSAYNLIDERVYGEDYVICDDCNEETGSPDNTVYTDTAVLCGKCYQSKHIRIETPDLLISDEERVVIECYRTLEKNDSIVFYYEDTKYWGCVETKIGSYYVVFVEATETY